MPVEQELCVQVLQISIVFISNKTRDPRKFVNTSDGALLDNTLVADSITTVNDALIPVDIFGKTVKAADKAQLLPKARDDATCCAILGLDLKFVDTEVTRKALLGCIDSQVKPPRKYPGARNLLCNILRMSNQGPLFDKSPYVFVFPICPLEMAKSWTGQGYDAIVICESVAVAQRIGMTNVTLDNAETATLAEINTASELALTVCEFLAHSVLQKSEEQVNEYQADGDRLAHQRFRSEKTIFAPFRLSAVPGKPVFRISFVGHDAGTRDEHPAPDPMLLSFKSCNKWCRKHAGFRMVAGAEPQELDDDLSEEGKRNLQEYLLWQAGKQKKHRHNEIMNLFGGNEGVHSSGTAV